MIVALLTGRAGSKSILGKNMAPVLGRPLAYYPMAAAKEATLLDAIYISTDSEALQALARDEGISVIDRPPELAQDDSELVDAIQHALEAMDQVPEILVTMHCNCAVHRPGLVDEAITKLRAGPEADSVVSGHTDRGVHPYRTRRVTSEGMLEPWFEVPPATSSNRQNLDPCFILDGAARALRVARCFPPTGAPPFSYFGRRVLPLENSAGGDIHGLEDLVVAEYKLRQLGWQPPA